jgi:hypothetical protein
VLFGEAFIFLKSDTIVAGNFLPLFFLAIITEQNIRKLFQMIPRGWHPSGWLALI